MALEQIGRYRIANSLGQGGMGKVYRAHDPDLDREVVLKFIALPDATKSEEWRQRFKREVQAAGRLNHPHIVTVYDVGLDHDPPYVVMELLTGGTWSDQLKRGPLPWRETLTLLRPLGQALAYAHQAGVIHRDVKPRNVMFAETDTLAGRPKRVLKLVDFGLAHYQGSESLTQTGMVFGTPAYMSPEQARGEVVDGRTDIFALGIMLFESMVGRNPLDKGSFVSTLAETISKRPIDLAPLTGPAPPEVIRLIERAVAKDREQRYPTCEALLADMARCLGGSADDEITDVTLRLPARSTTSPPPAAGPVIQKAGSISLTPEIEGVLRAMFGGFSRIAIEGEFGHGLSGGRVFRVRPVEAGGKAYLPAVVKIAPLGLIRQEWEAYQTWVENKLPGIARLESASTTTLPPGSLWDGLRYTLVGGGRFEILSLHDYYQRVSGADLRWVLENRLFQIIGHHWWLEHQTDRTFQMQADYDALLPINLLIRPTGLPLQPDAHLITPGQLSPPTIASGDAVHIQGFLITEVDPQRRQVTLNLPPAPEDQPLASYRLRLEEVADIERYRVGQVIDSLPGQVTATRHDLLIAQARQVLGEGIDLSAERLPLTPPPTPPLRGEGLGEGSLPNPLLAYQDILQTFLTVNISIIHGDFNLENILVDQATRDVSLIDFAAVRRGHALHDLLRLETEVVTKLVPAALAEANLPAETIYPFYQQLHSATFYSDQLPALKPPHVALEKALAMLVAIRTMARPCLFNPNDWAEYYQGLTLYLLGALKFKNLDQLPMAPLPKQVAFWGAATVVDLLAKPSPPPPPPLPSPAPAPKKSSALVWLGAGTAALACMLVFVLATFVWLVYPWPKPDQGEVLATIPGFKPEVKVNQTETDQLIPAKFGLELYPGDVVNVYAGASASIACTQNGLVLLLEEQRNMEVNEANCDPETTTAEVIGQLPTGLASSLVGASASVTVTLPPGATRAPRADQARLPLLLSPRNSAITATHPTFHWQPVEGASGYRLTLNLANGETWSRETIETSLAYPTDAPPLPPGTNIVTLTTLDDETVADKTLLRLPDEAGLAELNEAEAAILALPVDEATRSYLLAQLYRQYDLYSAAIVQLEQLVQTIPEEGSANLRQQLGDLYFEVGLYAQAEENYQAALAAAEANADLSAQAAAHLGLARVAHAFDEIEAALEHLSAAETLYQQAGQPELADQVAMERDKLQKQID